MNKKLKTLTLDSTSIAEQLVNGYPWESLPLFNKLSNEVIVNEIMKSKGVKKYETKSQYE